MSKVPIVSWFDPRVVIDSFDNAYRFNKHKYKYLMDQVAIADNYNKENTK